MLVNVIRTFRVAAPGQPNGVPVPLGEQEVPDEMVPGLIADGYLSPGGHEPVALTDNRRKSIIERLLADIRSEMETAPDELLLSANFRLDCREAEAKAAAEEEAEDLDGDAGEDLDPAERVSDEDEAPAETAGDKAPETSEPAPLEGTGEPQIEAPEVAPVERPGDGDADGRARENKTVPQLKAAIVDAGGEVPAGAKKEDLQKLLADLLAKKAG